MCAFCTMFPGGPHWTEGRHEFGAQRRNAGGQRTIRRSGLSTEAYQPHSQALWLQGPMTGPVASNLVHSHRGRTEVVEQLPQIWMTVEAIATRPVDPLDPQLLSVLDESGPVTPEEMR